MLTITIRFEEQDWEPLRVEQAKSGQTILEICVKHHVPLQHECGGICACSTCHVHIGKGAAHLQEAGQREKDLLARATAHKNNSRLACQCVLVHRKGEIEVVIPGKEDRRSRANGPT
ncbi:MAG TPA: 2Fe-2S iron-sulfur cluster-binding protein [Flavisolibacter sp.]|nr:2Fe-2S iron-sulfur cluster-binding protein [Flavisolibacter sp.]